MLFFKGSSFVACGTKTITSGLLSAGRCCHGGVVFNPSVALLEPFSARSGLLAGKATRSPTCLSLAASTHPACLCVSRRPLSRSWAPWCPAAPASGEASWPQPPWSRTEPTGSRGRSTASGQWGWRKLEAEITQVRRLTGGTCLNWTSVGCEDATSVQHFVVAMETVKLCSRSQSLMLI